MKLRRLLDALHRLDLRQNLIKQTRGIQQLKSLPGPAFGEDFQDLVPNPFRADQANFTGQHPNGFGWRDPGRSQTAPQNARPEACADGLR